jgi:hypothetical protein
MVGLANVDNTSDLDKPISTAQQTELNLKAPINNPTFTGTVSGITKSMVGLGNVDNTSDLDKPVSTAQQTELNLKAPLNAPTFTGTVSGITKNMVGLANVDNTSDANKPVSTAQQTELNLKAPLDAPTFTGTVSGITKNMVGLANVDNTSDLDKPISTAQQTELNLKAPINNPTFTGTVSGITKNMVGLANVDNTSDADKPVSTATTTQLNLKAPLNAPTFTGTVSGISKNMVGLGNVDNTSDADKPVSTAQQTALNLKQATITSTTNLEANTIQLDKLVVDGQISIVDSDNTNEQLLIRTSTTNTGINYKFKGDGLVFDNYSPETFFGTNEKRRLTFKNTRISATDPEVLFKGFSQLGTGATRGCHLFIGNFTRLSTGFQCENQSYNGNKFEFFHPPIGGSTNDLFKLQGFNTAGSLAPNNDFSAQMKFSYNGNLNISGTLTESSDRRIKENIVDANTSNLIEDFKKIRFVNYNLINDKEKIKKLGCIAQDLELIYPSCVIDYPNYEDDEQEILNEDIPYIKQIKYQPLYIKSMMVNQYLLNKIDELEERLAVLENQI